MIVREFYRTRADGVNLYRTYSDEEFKIRQIETDTIYDEAIDVETSNYTYEETNLPIELEEAETEDYIEALNELGVSEE